MIIHPIAAALALISLIAVLFHRGAGIALISFTLLATFLAFVFDMVLFGTAKARLNDVLPGSPAELGNANWIVLGALVAVLLASVFGCCLSHTRRERVAKV